MASKTPDNSKADSSVDRSPKAAVPSAGLPSLGARLRTEPAVRIVVAGAIDAVHSTRAFRVYSGWQCECFERGVAFTTHCRLMAEQVFLEIRYPDHRLCFESARIIAESAAGDHRWRYQALISVPVCRVDRYEFD